MTIWILAVVLLASLAGLGYRQGVVRVAFSFLGIVLGANLAVPLGGLIRPALSAAGLKHPVLLWVVPPFVMFCLVLTLFKIAGLFAHKKVELYHKYQAGELRYVLWERLSRRAGLCLGLANGLAYLILLSFVIYAVSYWTVQMAGAPNESRVIRIVNSLGKGLENTGMARVARAIDRLPPAYYDAADVVGTLYHNYSPRLATRLSAYPGFLSLGQRQELLQLAADADFKGLWVNGASLVDLVKHPKVNAILKNTELMNTLWAAAKPNLQDLNTFLTTGESPTFGAERIVGRWSFDVSGAMALERRLKPGLTAARILELRRYMEASLRNVNFVATPGQEVFLNNVPQLRVAAGAAPQLQTWQGQWKNSAGKYEVTLTVDGRTGQLPVELQGDQLSFVLEGRGFFFLREN